MVAQHETRCGAIHQRMCNLLGQQNQQKTTQTRNLPDHTRTFITVPDCGNGLYYQVTQIRQI
jgi:hypothetical protein